ncbi:MAG: flagellar biosynthesis protein FlhB [Clostridia bacterium]|jgi:flagellar biosynthetic protein FlhB|nr:flagellar biosynthesis protein FlhB [Clostridia bacterium]
MIEFRLNLQLFAGEKTEKATPKRRQEARRKGQVVKSMEINTVFVLTVVFLLLQVWIPVIYQDFLNFYPQVFSYASTDFTLERSIKLFYETVYILARMAGPLLLAAAAAGFAGNVAQVGFLFTTESFKLDFNRLNPVKGFQRIFSKRAIAELIKSVCKTVLVGYVAFSYLKGRLPGLSVLMDSTIEASFIYIGDITFTVSWRVILILFILAVADYAFQVYEYEQSLKMTKQEIKEEYKTTEGDPQLKARMRERQRQMAMQRMMQEVPKATVVITNPTHVAVALKYEEEKGVPEVVAKGQDLMAQRIKEIAADNSVAVVENKPLAWLLYKRVDLGMAIPVDLYQAVAEIIAYVYRLKKLA